MKLNQEAIQEVKQLIRDLEIDINAVEESHPLSEGRFEDVFLSINSAKDMLKEIEEDCIDSE
jgi:methyl-accepting chemotaxis protein